MMRLGKTLVLGMLLAGCGGAPAGVAPAVSSAPARAAASVSASPAAKPAASGQLTKVTAAYPNISGSNIPIFITTEGGYFRRNGLDVDLQFINGAAKSTGALLANQVEICHCGGSEALNVNTANGDLVVTAVLTPVYPYKFMAAPEIKTFNDLKGKPIGISSIGGAVDVVTRLVLRKNGLDPDKDVILVPDNGSTFRIDALLGGATKAAMADPPGLMKLEQNGFHAIANPAAEKIPTANSGVLAQRSWLTTHRDVMQHYIDALIEGTARAKKDKAFAVSAMKKYFKSDDDAAMSGTYDFFVNDVETLEPLAKPDQFTDSINELAKQNPGVKSYDISRAIDNSFVQSAIERGLAKQV
jgi:NitT/TauT family transport system substrate-binding protein